MKFHEYMMLENILVSPERVAMQIASGNLPPNMIKQILNKILDLLGSEGNDKDPYYLNLAAVARDDILPYVSQMPMFRQEADMLQALTS